MVDPYPDLVKAVPHVAFEVDDLTAALEDQHVIIEPNSPSRGVLVAFIHGWIKSRDWNISNVMLIWTVSWIIAIIGNIMAPPDYSAIQNQIQQQQQQQH